MDYFRAELIKLTFRGHSYAAPQDLFFDDEEEIRAQYWSVEQGDVVLDVGCGFGSYTLPALACGARVYAIDSSRDALQMLLSAAALNGFGNVTALRMAVYDGGHALPLALKRQHRRSKHSPPRGVHWATLDGLVAGGVIAERRVDWIKLDVEGVELGALQGGVKLLEQHHPRLVIENHERVYEWTRRAQSASRIYDLLHGLGYRIEVVPYVVEGTSPRDYIIGTYES